MELLFKPADEHPTPEQPSGQGASAGVYDFNQQCQRVLRCTAQFLFSTPGGLRFEAQTWPWLGAPDAARR